MKILSLKFIEKSFLFIFLVLFLVACCNNEDNSIRIGILNGPSAVSFIQLIDQAPVIDGKKVELIIKSEPQQIQALMMQGKLDFAILPTVMAANLYNKGVRYRMVACPIWGTLYVVTKTKIDKLADLKNQTISVFGQSSTSDILLQRIIQQNKISNVRIDYTLSTNNDISRALLSGKIKFGIVSEPFVSRLLAEDSSIHIVTKLTCEAFLQNSDKNIFVQTAFLVSDRFTERNHRLVAPVCNAYLNSCNFVNEHPERAAEMLVEYKLVPDINAAKQSIPLCNISYVGAFALQNELNRYLTIFYDFNPESIGGKMPDNGFILPSTE